MSAFAEPPRGLVAWDCLLRDVIALASQQGNLVAEDRKQCKTLAATSIRYGMAVASKKNDVRRKEEKGSQRVAQIMCSLVDKFWASVHDEITAKEHRTQKVTRRKDLHEKQMKALEGTERLLQDRAKLEIGTGATMPPLKLLEPIGDGLRQYQRIGVEWLMSLHTQNLNGILADEMGLGKTIQTIALFAYLAEHRGDWGPHLVVVPMSVLLNWDMEFKKWLPSFSVLVYHGDVKRRQKLRQGWSANSHLCNVVLVSYNTLLADKIIFRKRKWHYLILDEAHTIKSWESQRWQVLLNFSTEHRVLLSGTPLQNNAMELWSLLHFLMPDSLFFESYEDFKALYGASVPSVEVVQRLHETLRPFIVRRLKCDVEKQLPKKIEKVVLCPLSKRQRALYDEYMLLEETRATLASTNTLGILAVLMALRKVCNHPALFEERPVLSPFVVRPSVTTSFVQTAPLRIILGASREPELPSALLWQSSFGTFMGSTIQYAVDRLRNTPALPLVVSQPSQSRHSVKDLAPYAKNYCAHMQSLAEERCTTMRIRHNKNTKRFGEPWDVFPWLACRIIHQVVGKRTSMPFLAPTLSQRCDTIGDLVRLVVIALHRCVAYTQLPTDLRIAIGSLPLRTTGTLLDHNVGNRRMVFHPDKRLLQFDSGKLQVLAALLPRLQREGHKCLIFTQFRKVLDVLEEFLSMHFLRYVRLDGGTHVTLRQRLVTQFNHNPRIFAFLLSTRSGGLGLNLTGADTVIFFDSDWNPAIDLQAQDRCHRIGQTRDVTIYRLVSEHTVEERILLKARQKKLLNNVVLRAGGFQEVGRQTDSTEGALGSSSILDFFHDFDEDFNEGRGDPQRRQHFEGLLRQVEDQEDVQQTDIQLFDEDGPAATSSLVAYGLKVLRKSVPEKRIRQE